MIALLIGLFAMSATALSPVPPDTTGPWQRLVDHEGVEISFLFHRKADTHRQGVVVYLTNSNEHAVEFSFTLIFRTQDREHRELVTGRLAPGERRTGSEAGLFWIPFDDVCGPQGIDPCRIGEVGLRSYRVTRASSGTGR
jgi:hypothetical protein